MKEIIEKLIEMLKDPEQWNYDKCHLTHRTKDIDMWIGNLGHSYVLTGICPHFRIDGATVEADEMPFISRWKLMTQLIKSEKLFRLKNRDPEIQTMREILDMNKN